MIWSWVKWLSFCPTIFNFMHFEQYLYTPDFIFTIEAEIQQEMK